MPEWIMTLLSDTLEFLRTHSLQAAGVIFALLAGWTIAGWVRRSMLLAFERSKFDLTLARFFANLTRYAVIVATAIGCLGAVGFETTSFAAVIGAAGLAVGLAFQGSLSNFAAGVMLLVFRPFKVGDTVNAAGVLGTIEQIELFTTEFTTPDNRKVVVPNSTIFGGNIENVTALPIRRVDVDVGVEYSADIDATRAVLEKAIASVEGLVDDKPSVAYLKQLGASSVDWQIRLWCKTEDYWKIREAGIRAAKLHLDEAGLGIPFPQMDVHFDDKGLRTIAGDRAA